MKHLYTPETKDRIIQHITDHLRPENEPNLADQVRVWMRETRQDIPVYAGIRQAEGGRFLVATDDQRAFVESLGYPEKMPDTLVMHRYGFSIGIGFAAILERERQKDDQMTVTVVEVNP